MKKWRPLNKKIIISVLLILSFIINCGAFFSPTYVELDPEGKPSYRCIEMSEVISAVDREEFTDKYKEKFYRIYGTVRKIDLSKKEIKLSLPGDEAEILTFDNKASTSGNRFAEGDSVVVFFHTEPTIGKTPKFVIDRIERAQAQKVTEVVYSSAGGEVLKEEEDNKRTLGDGKAEYYIPDSWKGVEHNIAENELGTIDGYQYRLQDLKGSANYSESLFVTYFDYSKVDPNDRSKTAAIEKAVVRDILKKDIYGKFPLHTIKMPSAGPTLKYYRGNFTRSTGETYQAEFVFREERDGLIILLYVYREADHVDDIMNVMRTVKFNS